MLPEFPVLQHKDAVRILNGIEPVGDHQDGFAAQKLRHALAAITAEAQPLLQAGDPATRQGAQRILAAVDSLKE